MILDLTRPAADVRRQIREWLSGKRGPSLRPFARIREERGWSRPWAADLLLISAAHLGRLGRGSAPLSLALAERMARVYAVALDRLITAPE